MCGILILPANFVPPLDDKFKNFVWNNPHGFGLLIKDEKAKRILQIRECPEGGNDPQVIHKLLEEHKDLERFLHVRWKTDGDISLENTQPFTAYYSDKRQVYFMHNGILHEWKPQGTKITWENNVRKEEISPNAHKSDTRRFNEEFLSGVLLYGKGDIHNDSFKQILTKFWGSGNSKGILIANDQPSLMINPAQWKTVKWGDEEIDASNDDYFNNLQRGYEHERRRKEQEEARQKEKSERRFQPATGTATTDSKTGTRSHGWSIKNLTDIDFSEQIVVSGELAKLMEETDLFTPDGLASLAGLQDVELEGLVLANPKEAGELLVWSIQEYAELWKRYNKILNHTVKKNGEEPKVEEE